jgi:hypothetical protein
MPWNYQNVFGRDFLSAQSGTATILLSTASITQAITAVVTSKSILFCSWSNADSNDDPDKNLVHAVLTSSTLLTFTTSVATLGAITIQWYVIEFKSTSTMFVQRGTFAATAGVNNITLSTAVDLARSYPMVTLKNTESNFNAKSMPTAEITSTTNLQLTTVNFSGINYSWQVIDYSRWNVTLYTQTIITTDTTKDTAITSVIEAKTMLYGTGRDTDGGTVVGDDFFKFGLYNSTTIRAVRRVAGHNFTMKYYLVNTFGGVLCEHDTDQSIGSGSSTGNSGGPAMNISNSVARINNCVPSSGYNNTDATDAASTLYTRVNLSSTTNVLATRGAAPALQMKYSVSAYDFSNS